MNMTPRQIRIMVRETNLSATDFPEAFRYTVAPWHLAFYRKGRVFQVVVRGYIVAIIGAGVWNSKGGGLDGIQGQQAGLIENLVPLDFIVRWNRETDCLEVFEYLNEE